MKDQGSRRASRGSMGPRSPKPCTQPVPLSRMRWWQIRWASVPESGGVPVLIAVERSLALDDLAVIAVDAYADRDHPGGGVSVRPGVRDCQDLEGSKDDGGRRHKVYEI